MIRFRDRRSMRTLVAVASIVLAVAGCGFHLRGAANYTFSSIALNAPAAPSMATELKRALEATGSAEVIDDPKKAQVILDVPLVADDKEVLSLSGGGSVREYLLIKRVSFRLPDTDGVELLRRIRLSQPKLPVIITTAYMSIEPQLKVLNLPHSGYIVKPFRLDELGARIDAVS
jgi:DNA-binding response OmpR family regulator